ncbi:MAG TPA: hypothetical protein PK325_14400, partial [Cyclobacteriaceae bacterium]|nr:hypothetical protein [Cyclobacteriaceae bacterium]HMX51813.1 hypothetical protein [Cyclobacteriaceae bacterium]HNC14061.1 hypothetical protein [Cyclobacteriaceae bacterium]HNF81341.1 hypothetical protein [Cyclobacteriaceae bacterium]HNG42491.1 hypothetical protein [Cyclobacteriaceae bacterium]
KIAGSPSDWRQPGGDSGRGLVTKHQLNRLVLFCFTRSLVPLPTGVSLAEIPAGLPTEALAEVAGFREHQLNRCVLFP